MLNFILIGAIADALESEGRKVKDADATAELLGRRALSANALMCDLFTRGKIAEAENIRLHLPRIYNEANEAQFRFERIAADAKMLLLSRTQN